MSHCPCHPEEARDAEFDRLEELIRLGWGSVPQPEIERLRRRNGGVLPERPPKPRAAAGTEAFRDWVDVQMSTGATRNAIILDAVKAGYSTTVDVATATGMTPKRVALVLFRLRHEGLVTISRAVRNRSQKGVAYVYRAAEASDAAA